MNLHNEIARERHRELLAAAREQHLLARARAEQSADAPRRTGRGHGMLPRFPRIGLLVRRALRTADGSNAG